MKNTSTLPVPTRTSPGQSHGRLRWGVAGTGGISRQITADFTLVDNADVVAVSSRHASSAKKFAETFGIPTSFHDYSSMLDADIDAVYIGTPHVTHFELAREALERGRHVLCEKPIGLNAAEVRELAAIASESGVFLMEAMWMKFNPLYLRLREIVDDGVIGELRSVRSSFGAPFPRDDSSRWKPGGSALLDQGIYPVTLGHMFLGDPSSITAAGVAQEDGIDLSQITPSITPAGASPKAPARWSAFWTSPRHSAEPGAGSPSTPASGLPRASRSTGSASKRAKQPRRMRSRERVTATCPCSER